MFWRRWWKLRKVLHFELLVLCSGAHLLLPLFLHQSLFESDASSLQARRYETFLNSSHLGCRSFLYHLHQLTLWEEEGRGTGPPMVSWKDNGLKSLNHWQISKRWSWSSVFTGWAQMQLLKLVFQDRQIAFGGGGLFKNSDALVIDCW